MERMESRKLRKPCRHGNKMCACARVDGRPLPRLQRRWADVLDGLFFFFSIVIIGRERDFLFSPTSNRNAHVGGKSLCVHPEAKRPKDTGWCSDLDINCVHQSGPRWGIQAWYRIICSIPRTHSDFVQNVVAHFQCSWIMADWRKSPKTLNTEKNIGQLVLVECLVRPRLTPQVLLLRKLIYLSKHLLAKAKRWPGFLFSGPRFVLSFLSLSQRFLSLPHIFLHIPRKVSAFCIALCSEVDAVRQNLYNV